MQVIEDGNANGILKILYNGDVLIIIVAPNGHTENKSFVNSG